MVEYAALGGGPDYGFQLGKYWPKATWSLVQARTLTSSDRRLEAESYLSDGYGLRRAIESRPTARWRPLADLAEVWQPNRLRGVVVPAEHGVPYFAAGQVFELQPTPRRWLSLKRTSDLSSRYVRAGTILVSRSGNVGRVTVAHGPYLDAFVTDDLLRVEPHDEIYAGWLYFTMRNEQFRSMARGSQYGHVIKHLEASHLGSLPVLSVSRAVLEEASDAVRKVFGNRQRAHELIAEAESLYESELDYGGDLLQIEQPYSVSARSLVTGRRRLDAYHNNSYVGNFYAHCESIGVELDTLGSVCSDIWWPARFRRYFGENGSPYVSAEDIFNLNPPIVKRVYAGLIKNRDEYRLRPGWLVMARSGQVYGLLGSVTMVTAQHAKMVVSEDLIRLAPDEQAVRSGYLLCALGHPRLGRPLTTRQAYGTSIPHLEPADVAIVRIPRLDVAMEAGIADLVESAFQLRAEADEIEDRMTAKANAQLETFLHGA